jgi:poly-gamma-glutamate synthase PgsB/CapB
MNSLIEIWGRFQDYFISLYQNSVAELAVFVIVFGALFFGLHVYLNAKFKYWRKRIPLVIGGWGTRGKSGTERLKAALFNALGLGVVSKTTGCEAMFLHAHPFGRMKEMYLFRPYDKATIWEQVNVVRIAGRLETDVMLWECMGLTPAYVKILQRCWMHDDYATITNTYPDHEDLQGPAGINIPEVIGCFIPEKSTVITSEEQMLPILATEAEQCKTTLLPITWLEAGLIPNDILQRFPYEEHPYNIALVVGLAEQLGIDRDFALKEMGDRVVPDLGVLKTFPAATIRTRRLEFTNGMSANEQFGTISNWIRTGFDRQDAIKEPGVWLTTVVNNRADRIPRSQVFASVLVNDISADRHVLIGGNLHGLLGYIREAWSVKAPQISLWKDPAAPNPADALKVLEQQALQMRLPIRPELIQAHLRTMLSTQPQITNAEQMLACWDNPDAVKLLMAPLNLGEIETAILNNLQLELRLYREYHDFAEQVRQARPDQAGALDQRLRELLQQWFQTKIIVVEDYFASGNQIIDLIAQHTPPGFLNRVMGIQNIKGTGLDFVYRWQAWQECYNATRPLRAEKVLLTPQLLAPLAEFKEYGVLCDEHVRETIQRVKNSGQQQPPQLLAELDLILSRLDSTMKTIQQQMKSTGGKQGGWFTTCLLRLEEFLDCGDAVRRRKQADRIYEDFIAERISRDRTVLELQARTQRQKGGWLLKKFAAMKKARRPKASESGKSDGSDGEVAESTPGA